MVLVAASGILLHKYSWKKMTYQYMITAIQASAYDYCDLQAESFPPLHAANLTGNHYCRSVVVVVATRFSAVASTFITSQMSMSMLLLSLLLLLLKVPR